MSGPCEKCGRDLYKAISMRNSWAEIPYHKQLLPDTLPTPNVNVPIEKLKEFNSNLTELLEFAAWICGKTPEKFCKMDMLVMILKVNQLKDGDLHE